MFLEGDGALALCPEWQRLQPANGTLLDGMARLPKQLLGTCTRNDHPCRHSSSACRAACWCGVCDTRQAWQ